MFCILSTCSIFVSMTLTILPMCFTLLCSLHTSTVLCITSPSILFDLGMLGLIYLRSGALPFALIVSMLRTDHGPMVQAWDTSYHFRKRPTALPYSATVQYLSQLLRT